MTWPDDVKDLIRLRFSVTAVSSEKRLYARDVDLENGTFHTEKLPPGKYTLNVQTTQRVGTNKEFFGNTRLAGTVLHTEGFKIPFEVGEGPDDVELGDVELDPAKDPRGDALKKRDAERSANAEERA